MLSIIEAAGWPIWLIIVTSVIALAIIGERFWSLRQSVVAPREVLPATNTVVVGRRDEIAQRSFSVDGARFTAGEPPRERFEASVRIRHRAPDVPAEVTMVGRDRFVVETAEPVWAPAPGQAAVLYDGDECLGGARITRA